MIIREWKAVSGPLCMRLFILDTKGEEEGLTDEEREEYERIHAEVGRILFSLLADRRHSIRGNSDDARRA